MARSTSVATHSKKSRLARAVQFPIEALERRNYLAAISFTASPTVAANSDPQGIVVGDFNNDQKPDVAVTNYSPGTVSILLGDGAGGLAVPGALSYAAGANLSGVATADLNGDGNLDLVTTGDEVSYLLGNGNGTFDIAVPMAAGDTPQSSTIADINDDDKLDIITSNVLGTFATLFEGKNDGTFEAGQDITVAAQADGAIGDINGDAFPDLAFALFGDLNTGAGAGVAVMLGVGDGTFEAAKTFSVNKRPSSIALGDFDEDGKNDIVVANGGFATLTGSNNFSFLKNTGNGNFAAAANVSSGELPNDLVVVDFNNDGHLDVATTNGSSTGAIFFHEGKGDGTFKAAQNLAVASGGSGIAAVDLNADGRLDIVSTNTSSNLVSTLINTTPFATLSGGILTVDGTSSADVFVVSISKGKLRVNRNGAVQQFTPSAVTQINLSGGAGNDSISIGASVVSTFVDGGTGNDVIVSDPTRTAALDATGAGGNDKITGGAGDDELSGANGKDRIYGGTGNDYLLGGASNDYLNGEAGNDTCSGAGGKDIVYGNGGADYLLGGAGNDYLDGLFVAIGTDGVDTLSGNSGSDSGAATPDDLVSSIENLA